MFISYTVMALATQKVAALAMHYHLRINRFEWAVNKVQVEKYGWSDGLVSNNWRYISMF